MAGARVDRRQRRLGQVHARRRPRDGRYGRPCGVTAYLSISMYRYRYMYAYVYLYLYRYLYLYLYIYL